MPCQVSYRTLRRARRMEVPATARRSRRATTAAATPGMRTTSIVALQASMPSEPGPDRDRGAGVGDDEGHDQPAAARVPPGELVRAEGTFDHRPPRHERDEDDGAVPGEHPGDVRDDHVAADPGDRRPDRPHGDQGTEHDQHLRQAALPGPRSVLMAPGGSRARELAHRRRDRSGQAQPQPHGERHAGQHDRRPVPPPPLDPPPRSRHAPARPVPASASAGGRALELIEEARHGALGGRTCAAATGSTGRPPGRTPPAPAR